MLICNLTEWNDLHFALLDKIPGLLYKLLNEVTNVGFTARILITHSIINIIHIGIEIHKQLFNVYIDKEEQELLDSLSEIYDADIIALTNDIRMIEKKTAA